MQIRALHSPEEFARYGQCGHEVYRQHPCWVPSDMRHLIQLLSGNGPGQPHTRVQAFWVEEGSQILATLTAVIHERYNHHWQEQMGHFLLFEAFPDHDAATQSRQRPAALQHLAQAIDHGVLLIIGVQRRYRGRGINLALAAKSYLAMMARGYKSASYTLVLDDNWPSRRTAEKLGGASPAIL